MDRGTMGSSPWVAESWPRLSEHIPPMPCASQLQATAHTANIPTILPSLYFFFSLDHFTQSHGSSMPSRKLVPPCCHVMTSSHEAAQLNVSSSQKAPLCSVPRHVLSEFPHSLRLYYSSLHITMFICLLVYSLFPIKMRAGILSFHHCVSSD